MLAEGASAVKVTDRPSTDGHTSDPASIAAGIERAIQRGELRDALARCARAYGPALGRLCMAFMGSQAEAEELVQETLLAAHDAFPQYRGEGSVRAFLFGIARKVCARAVERRARRDARLRLVHDDQHQQDASELAVARQRALKAREALEALKPTEREALLLRYEGDLSFREVAEACGCDEAAARKRVSRALLRLRETLKDQLLKEEGGTMTHPVTCNEVHDELARVVDGTAPTDLYDHIAECDACRDLRHDAATLLPLLQGAGADYQPPADLEARLLDALDRRTTAVLPIAQAPSQAPMASHTQTAEPAQAPTVGHTQAPESAPASPPAAPRAPGEVRSLRPRVAILLASVAAVAAGSALFFKFSSSSPSSSSLLAARSSWSAEVASLARSSDAPDAALRCDSSGNGCAPLAVGDKLAPGSLLRTGRHGRLQLRMSDGSQLVLDHDSELLLRDDQPRSARLARGGLLADITHLSAAPNARLAFPAGSLEVLGTKFVVRSSPERSSVQVARGTVQLSSDDGSSERVFAGEEGRVAPSKPVAVFPSPVVSEGFWLVRSLCSPRQAAPRRRSLGAAAGRGRAARQEARADARERQSRAPHQARGEDAHRRRDRAHRDRRDLHQRHRRRARGHLPLPPAARRADRAPRARGRRQADGGRVRRSRRGAAIWRGVIQNAAPKAPRPREEIIWVPGPWRDPALLEWQRGGRFELRIFPIPKRGSRRVVLTYTQTLEQTAGVRRYTYPLPYDGQGKSKLESFKLQAQVRGHDAAQGVKAVGYTVQEKQENEATRLELNESGFRPSGDLVLEYAMANPQAEVTAWAYQPASAQGDDGSPYVALALRPRLPRRKEKEAHEQVFVVDTSRSMVGERLRRAKALVGGMIRELESSDHVQVLACDVGCRAWDQGSVEAGADAAEAAERFLGGEDADGSSNLAEMVKEGKIAGEKARGSRGLNVVYVGDGSASAGATKPDHLASEVRRALKGSEGRVTTVALGSDADVPLLEAMARGGGGVVVPYIPGQRTSEAALSAVGAMNGVVLREAELELPAGFVSVAPSKLEPVRAGGEVWVVGRMSSRMIEGEAVLRGKVGGEKYEQKYVVKVEATGEAGNAFVPRVYAAGRIGELEKYGGEGSKKAIEELSKRYAVASRYTSMLVLESEAMMKAFGLNRASSTPQWTGDQQAVSTTTRGTMEVPDAEESKSDKAKDEAESAAAGPMATAPMAPPAAKAAMGRSGSGSGVSLASPFDADDRPMPSRRQMVPMKKVWDRKGSFFPDASAWHAREESKILSTEGSLAAKPDSRTLTADLFSLYARHNRVERAADLADKWASRDALDLDALLARSDAAARSGDRARALRRLASLADVRPDDAAAQLRLAELFERLGDRERSCAHRVTLAESKADDTKVQVAAVRCAREIGATDLADRLLADLPQARRDAVFKALEAPLAADSTALKGDVRLEATWDSDTDLDLALIDPRGRRVSWQGGSKAAVSAQDTTSPRGEKVAWSNLGSGSYVLEVTRSKAGETAAVRGTVTVRVVGETRSVPFVLTGGRAELGRLEISYSSRLVPAW
jgi:RNA polymerase sigma factor (sigma-70 family)